MAVASFDTNTLEEKRHGLVTVHLEPVGTHQVLLVEHGVVGAQEPKVLELKEIGDDAMKVIHVS